MKKALSLLMAALLMLSLFACKPSDNSTDPTDSTDNSVVNGTEAETTTPESKPIDAEKPNGNEFNSTHADIRFTKPENWEYITGEELAEKLEVEPAAVDRNSLTEDSDVRTVYDMMATNQETNDNVISCYMNMFAIEGGHCKEELFLMDEETFAFSEYESVEKRSQDWVKLGGEDYLKAVYDVSENGEKKVVTYYLRCIDNFTHTVVSVVSADSEDVDIDAMFG